ncbi:unnamed protein product [Vitrella brassicaformis CCMP3155]|uniref:Tyrosine-protein kinase ephrin type A/B receptor-like domain-containing protein n=1 Tax=Vitrella brassicaformis (strain CCMP3155) TaxID=1169540 RepID=A0A0G4EI88_VITBC|nr:unnamed protein product [Vitrella brassicaformis CCMP3155]|eukprot:CEL95718.1 unnamed protein product [Vitrella brassicaformis CCMP3155]
MPIPVHPPLIRASHRRVQRPRAPLRLMTVDASGYYYWIPKQGEEGEAHCRLCELDYYCLGGKDEGGAHRPRQPCPANAVTLQLGADNVDRCQCEKGYEQITQGDEWVCLQCEPHTFKDTIGNTPCRKCTDIGFQYTRWIPRANGEVAPISGATSEEDCTCQPGYFWKPYRREITIIVDNTTTTNGTAADSGLNGTVSFDETTAVLNKALDLNATTSENMMNVTIGANGTLVGGDNKTTITYGEWKLPSNTSLPAYATADILAYKEMLATRRRENKCMDLKEDSQDYIDLMCGEAAATTVPPAHVGNITSTTAALDMLTTIAPTGALTGSLFSTNELLLATTTAPPANSSLETLSPSTIAPASLRALLSWDFWTEREARSRVLQGSAPSTTPPISPITVTTVSPSPSSLVDASTVSPSETQNNVTTTSPAPLTLTTPGPPEDQCVKCTSDPLALHHFCGGM